MTKSFADSRLAADVQRFNVAAQAPARRNEWKVEISGLRIVRPPTSCSTRSAISAAALLVNVTARMESGVNAHVFNEVGDAVGDDARLAAARAGQDEHRPVGGFDGFALLRD